jgi:ZIP family zinc transporter
MDVFLFRKSMSGKSQKVFLGFAAGVMIAGLRLEPFNSCHLEEAAANGKIGWIPAAGGFNPWHTFLLGLDQSSRTCFPARPMRKAPARP